MPNRKHSLLLTVVTLLMLGTALSSNAQQRGWTRIFDGKTLDGWTLVNGSDAGYLVEDGCIVAPEHGGGDLYTVKEYSDFTLRFEFNLSKAGNNGISIRSSMQGSGSWDAGTEIQILDDYDPVYANLEPGQYCGSIYKFVPVKRGLTKPAGQWNKMEITCIGRHWTVKINNQLATDYDLNNVTDPHVFAEHPALWRDKGHLGFLGHDSKVSFRNIEVKDLSKPEKDNTPPAGFTALFNGKNLTGWKGLVGDPESRAKMTPDELKAQEKTATTEALKHWKVVDGVITYDGKNNSLCTDKDYGDFEMLVDWKIEPHGDSGIYLRGSPQVQIWDDQPAEAATQGSGGLYNNQKNARIPLQKADNPPGEWNRFRILMVGDKVTVYLNNKLVVNNVVMENYWDRNKPIYPTGQIELQHHGSHLEFKNIYIREIGTNK